MSSGGGPGLQSRAGGNRIVPGGFDSHPFRHEITEGHDGEKVDYFLTAGRPFRQIVVEDGEGRVSRC
jgi:hypothetical protein